MNLPFNWPKAPITLKALIDSAAQQFEQAHLFFGHGTDNAWDEALWLALHALNLPWSIDDSELQQSLSQTQVDLITQLFQRRITERQPAAYLTGRAYFGGLEFIVSADVLVPRSPIAELIANQFYPWLVKTPAKILDLCTGSGCIGIACAYAFPDAQVDCTDISSKALTIAQRNITLHKMEARVRAIESNVFDGLSERYDLIVSNPPYVDANDLSEMPDEYRAEPQLGLAAGIDGLDICRRILKQASRYLSDQGCLVVEVGNSWQALEAAYPQVGFTWVEFEYGGDGVFVLSAEELQHYAPYFDSDDIIA